jgi:hypothetical protein
MHKPATNRQPAFFWSTRPLESSRRNSAAPAAQAILPVGRLAISQFLAFDFLSSVSKESVT